MTSLPQIRQSLHEVEIPSTKGKMASVRQMKLSEEKILLMAKEGQDHAEILRAVRQIVANCLVSMPVTPSQLTLFDIEYLFLKIRSLSISNIAEVSYRDNGDNKVYDFTIDLNTVKVEFPEKEIKEVAINDDITVTLRYPSAMIYADREFLELRNETLVYEYLIRHCIQTVKSKDAEPVNFASASKQEQIDFVSNLPAKAFFPLKDFLDTLPSLKHTITYENANGVKREIVLKALSDFFTLS
jgi:hypothetical protein